MEQIICVTVEIREGPVSRRARVTAPSIRQALAPAGDGKPGRRVRLIFPIEAESFFVLHGTPDDEVGGELAVTCTCISRRDGDRHLEEILQERSLEGVQGGDPSFSQEASNIDESSFEFVSH